MRHESSVTMRSSLLWLVAASLLAFSLTSCASAAHAPAARAESTAAAATSDVGAAITEQLHRYESALNSSDLDGVMQLYATDAVFMPQHGQPAVGREAVRAAYQQVFATIEIRIRFQIDEVQVLSPEWAYVRTRSTGTARLVGGDRPPGPEANQELFLLHREADGQWRFARYIFSTTNPPGPR